MDKPVVMTPEEEDRTAGVDRSFDGNVYSEETPIKVLKREHHSVTSTFDYYPLPSEIIKEFGSIEKFEKCISEDSDYEDQIRAWQFLDEMGHSNREDDWWTDRKGGYEVDYEIIKND